MIGVLSKNWFGRWEILRQGRQPYELTSGSVFLLKVDGVLRLTRMESRRGEYYSVDGYPLAGGSTRRDRMRLKTARCSVGMLEGNVMLEGDVMMSVDEPPLTRHEQLRRVVQMCGTCLRNIAYYRAGWDGTKPFFASPIHKQINSNFIDMAVIEWCKLFGEPKHEPQHWQHIIDTIDKRKAFMGELIAHVGGDRHDWNKHRTRCMNYRNDFLAHVGLERTMHLPHLDMCQRSAVFYARLVYSKEMSPPVCSDPEAYYQDHLEEGLKFYGRPLSRSE
jgi:hypothetical protein